MRTSQFLAGVLCVAMGVVPIVPPEHMHEAETDGHEQVFVHRHLPAHRIADHPDHGRHHEAAQADTVDHDDDPVLTISGVYRVPAAAAAANPLRAENGLIDARPRRQIRRAPADVDVLIHGPPRAPTGLRAPPFSPTA